MPHCILTTKDLTILEVMYDRYAGQPDHLVTLLHRKISTAMVVLRQDVPPNVATLNSRVEFSVDGQDPDMRIICQGKMTSPIGRFLPITTLRGLALLGLTEGQSISSPTREDGSEEIRLLRVLHQPEAAQGKMQSRLVEHGVKPTLRLISGGKADYAAPSFTTPCDDPGPSAA